VSTCFRIYESQLVLAGLSCAVMGVLGFFSPAVMEVEDDNTNRNEGVPVPQA
jgi:hypothetical protein